MKRHLDQVEFTIFDTETTGLSPQTGDRIVEIAGVRFKADEEIARFHALVNPQREISEAAFAVNHISQEMVDAAPKMFEVMPKFLDFILGSCLCSYNAPFDMGFLDKELELIERPALEGVVVVDILKMARRLMPGLQRYALWFVAERLGIKAAQEHRASSDVDMTWRVFKRLKNMLAGKGITEFKSLVNLFSINQAILEDINNRKISQIQEAIDLAVKVRIRYLSSANAEVSERDVIPKEIRQEGKYNYLAGHCCLRNEERIFRIDNILNLEIA